MTLFNSEKFSDHSAQKGFSLIEVMVTVFVMAIGIMGVVGMQAVGISESNNLYFRTVADFHMNDIVDRMKANSREARKGTGSNYHNLESTGNFDPNLSCINSVCDESNMALFDGRIWSEGITTSSLPDAEGIVQFVQEITSTSGTVIGAEYQVFIYWDEEKKNGSKGEDCQNGISGDKSCLTLTVQI